jgi:hypothetical protein
MVDDEKDFSFGFYLLFVDGIFILREDSGSSSGGYGY